MTLQNHFQKPNIPLIIIAILILVMIAQKLFGQSPEQEFLSMVNSYRQKHLVPKLEYRSEGQDLLTAVAKANAKKFCHCHAGAYAGEIITMTGSVEDALWQFKHSTPHRRAMLKRSFDKATVGIYKAKIYTYVVVRFY